MEFKKGRYLEQGASCSSIAATTSQDYLNFLRSVGLDDNDVKHKDIKELNKLLKKRGITKSHNIWETIKERRRKLKNRGKIDQY